jgi:hypothetical protein
MQSPSRSGTGRRGQARVFPCRSAAGCRRGWLRAPNGRGAHQFTTYCKPGTQVHVWCLRAPASLKKVHPAARHVHPRRPDHRRRLVRRQLCALIRTWARYVDRISDSYRTYRCFRGNGMHRSPLLVVCALTAVLCVAAPAAGATLQADAAGALWVADAHALLKLAAPSGDLLLAIGQAAGTRALAVDSAAGRIWAYGGGTLRALDLQGQALFEVAVPLPAGGDAGAPDSGAALAVNCSFGSGTAQCAPDGALLRRKLPGPGSRADPDRVLLRSRPHHLGAALHAFLQEI